MSQSNVLTAEARERVGKGSARAIRRSGNIPAVIYGEKQPPIAITLPYKEVFHRIHAGGFKTTIFTVKVNGQSIQALPKDYQLDPVRGFPMHVDFLRVGRHTVVTVNVPVRFLNEEQAPGIKRGGVLNVARHEVEFTCPANAIPDFIEVDLTGLDIGDTVHISAVKLPEGVTPTITDRDFTIASIAAPAGMKSEESEEAAEAQAEGESGEAE
ncbi:50S ribosomal protein L25/general stress protein Ctc [Chelativorans sp. Marseille-P2723]|uniref:50S ribosomal protein L25/general stress protein Ctc n=1 Tax=Chelativorans sp. Marseille-P2723 TaxID=2709133 RepID=UPI00156DB881|nr:50S ribosomal protein L25/general stress protein Ctc [Chelativorans sp. Marseille-P2723]